MSSIAAKEVALEVLDTVGKGRRPILGHIIKKKGYAQNTADSPKQVTETKSYKDIINPVIEKMITERDRVLNTMSKKDLNKVQYESLSKAVDTLTKNIQLLGGKSTENNEITLKWE